MNEFDLLFKKNEDYHFDRTSDIHRNRDSTGIMIAAFATEKGGTILFGQDNSRQEVGIGISEQQFITTLGEIREHLSPHPSVEGPHFEKRGDRIFATVRVISLGAAGPCFYKKKAYKRHEDKCLPMTNEEIFERWKKFRKINFEERVTAATVDQIDQPSLNHYLDIIKAKKDGNVTKDGFLAAHHLAENGQLTSLGAIVLARDPAIYIPATRVTAVRFQGTTPINRVAAVNLAKPLHLLVADCENFFKVNLPVIERFEGLVRIEETAIPNRVLREALLNLLVHRDYDSTTETLIRIFDDRIEFINPSIVTTEELQKILKTAVPVHPNPLIYNIIRLLGLGEGAGQGLPIIWEYMRKQGLPEPVIDKIGNNIILTLRYGKSEFDKNKKAMSSAFELLKEKKTISTSDLMKKINVNRLEAIDLLDELVKRKIARHTGKRRNSRYHLVEN